MTLVLYEVVGSTFVWPLGGWMRIELGCFG